MSMEDPGPTAAERLGDAVKKWQANGSDVSAKAQEVSAEIRSALEATGFVCTNSQQRLVASLFGPEVAANIRKHGASGPGHEIVFTYHGETITMLAREATAGGTGINLLIVDLRRSVIILRSSPHEAPRELPYSLDVILDAAADYVEHLLEQRSRPVAPVLPPGTE